MDPSSVSCPTLACADTGQAGGDNIGIHSHVERRYRCRTCGHTCAATTNTPRSRRRHPAATMTPVLTLLLHGCPIPAIVAAFTLDERTVRAWRHKAGAHAVILHDRLVADVAAHQVQADAIRVRVRGGAGWAAVALDVGSRLWLATAVARRRDGLLVHLLLRRTLATRAGHAFLLAVDGFASYITAARALLRMPERTGRRGRPRLVWPQGFALAQVVKAGLAQGQGIVRRVVVGTEAAVAAALSDRPIVVERPEYFRSPNDAGVAGSDVFGFTHAASRWVVPGGAFAAGDSEFLLLYNPDTHAARVKITFYTARRGSTVTVPLAVPASARFTFDVNAYQRGGRRHPGPALTVSHGALLQVSQSGQIGVEHSVFGHGHSTLQETQGLPIGGGSSSHRRDDTTQ